MGVKQFKYLIYATLILSMSSCAIKTTKYQSQDNGGKKTIVTNPLVIDQKHNQNQQNQVEALPQVESSQSNQEPDKQAAIENSSSSNQAKPIPKFGFIFSGGGAKAWAHIGVLKEMQKLKWPVNSVAGFEWGSAVAAIYAQNLSANEVEWEMSKLKEFDKWDQFVKAAFAKKTTAELRIPFVCPSLNISKQSIYLLNRGQLNQLLPFCIGSTTLTKPINQSIGVLNDVSSLAQHLKATGSNKIILINVLSQNTKRSFVKDYESNENIQWVESAALMAKKPIGVDEVIDINLDDFGLKDLEKRRDISNKGAELSAPILRKIAEKYSL